MTTKPVDVKVKVRPDGRAVVVPVKARPDASKARRMAKSKKVKVVAPKRLVA